MKKVDIFNQDGLIIEHNPDEIRLDIEFPSGVVNIEDPRLSREKQGNVISPFVFMGSDE